MKINAFHIHNKACSTALMMLCCMVFFSCVKVDLCEESSHEHLSDIKLIYHWPDSITNDERPDSMFAFFNRFTSAYRIGYITDSETSVGGHYLFGKINSLFITDSADQQSLKAYPGEYRALAFNKDAMENTEDYHFEIFGNFFNENSLTQSDFRNLYISYVAHEITDSCLYPYGKNWSTANPEYKYISTNIKPIYLAENRYNEDIQSYKQTFNVQKDSKSEIHLYPQKITQDITISFPIYTEFIENLDSNSLLRVDSIIAEISGIPHKMCIDDRTLMVDTIYKMLFKMDVNTLNVEKEEIEIDSVKKTFSKWECTSTISVMGLLTNVKETNYGAGILQLCIYLGNRVYKAKINMRTIIEDANLVIEDEFGRKVQNPGIYPERPFNSILRIDESFLIITHDFVLNTLNSGSSLDSWQGDKDGDGEIDNDHKLELET